MIRSNTSSLLVAGLLLCLGVNAQSGDGFWSATSESSIRLTGTRQIVPQKYVTASLNGSAVKDKLFAAPNESSVKMNESSCILTLPAPDGTLQRFRVVESPVMAPELAAAFPQIKTFSIKGIDDPYANGKLDWNEFGFHGMVRSIKGDFYIDPYCLGNTMDYISYYTRDFVKDPAHTAPEIDVIPSKANQERKAQNKQPATGARALNSNPAPCMAGSLSIYRLAVACTGEYAVAATGQASPSIAQTLAKIVTSVNRVDGVYETDVDVRMVLVPTETMVVFTNASTDPFTANNNGGNLLGESQTVISSNIGLANFDIGHTFSTGGGGVAYLGCVCDNNDKGRGITGSSYPVGDPYDIDYVAHEMGHQFDGNHTFNSITGSCNGNRNASTSTEPGSGITIMAYAGICSVNDLSNHSIAYFHATSYDEIINFTTAGNGASCPTVVTNSNQAPVVNCSSSAFTIPVSTPFVLTGSGYDPDGDSLTYSWEEMDPGPGAGGNWNSGNAPFFRSYTPTPVPTRYFPLYNLVLSNNYTTSIGEFLPTTPQTMNFRLTARDNKMGGGGVCYDVTTVTSVGGPFSVTAPNVIGVSWAGGTQQTVSWAVNGTDLAPVSCPSVNILISYDSGQTFSVLLSSTPNDGVQLISVPNLTTTISTCRIKVECANNIFYDLDNYDFTITAVATGIASASLNQLGLALWPNPTSHQLNIAAGNLNSQNTTQLVIMDVLGKVVLQNNYSNKVELKESIDLSSFSKGVYIVKLSNGSNQAVQRIVKD